MLYSTTCLHALRALTFLAGHTSDGHILVRDIASAEGLPKPYLAKILHGLQARGLVISRKGPKGGYALARSSGHVTASDIIEAVDGPLEIGSECILGLDECRNEGACRLHGPWLEYRDTLLRALRQVTLADMAETLRRKRRGRSHERRAPP